MGILIIFYKIDEFRMSGQWRTSPLKWVEMLFQSASADFLN
jgi:hypothetical protein